MADSGTVGADLWEMWHAGHVKLPAVAKEFRAAISKVYAPGNIPFWRSSDLGSAQDGPFDAWDALRQELIGFLEASDRNMQDCGTALVQVAEHFAATDQAAGAVFDAKKKQMGY